MRERWKYLNGHPRTCTCVRCAERNVRNQRQSDSGGSAQTVVPRTPRRPKDPPTIDQHPASPADTGRRQGRTSKERVKPPSAYSPSQQTVARRETGKVAQFKPLQEQTAPTARQSTGPPPRYAPGSALPPLGYRRRNGLSAVFRALTTLIGVGVVVVIAVYIGVVLVHFNNGFPAADALIEGVMADAEFAVDCRPDFERLSDFINRDISVGHGFECR